MAQRNRKKDRPKKVRVKGAARTSQQQCKREIDRLIEGLHIDPTTGKTKRGAIANLIEQQKNVFSWVTRDIANKARQQYKKKPPASASESSSASDYDTTAEEEENDSQEQRKKAGCPKGTTDDEKRVQNQQEKLLINKISEEYTDAKKKAGTKKTGTEGSTKDYPEV
jgi:hypothetical protein